MATLPTLRPNGQGTLSNVNNQAGSTTNIYLDCDDDPDSPTTTDYIKNATDTNGNKTAFLLFDDMPSDFASMSALQVDCHIAVANFSNDTCTLFAQMFQSNETSTLSNEVQVATQAQTGLRSISFTGLSAGTKIDWDGARLKFRWSYSRSAGADGGQLRVTAVELDGTYDAAVSATPTPSTVSVAAAVDATTVVAKAHPSVAAASASTPAPGITAVTSADTVSRTVTVPSPTAVAISVPESVGLTSSVDAPGITASTSVTTVQISTTTPAPTPVAVAVPSTVSLTAAIPAVTCQTCDLFSLAPGSIAANSGFTGTVTDIDDDPDSPDGAWVTGTGGGDSIRVTFPTPSGNPCSGEVQEFRVLVRLT